MFAQIAGFQVFVPYCERLANELRMEPEEFYSRYKAKLAHREPLVRERPPGTFRFSALRAQDSSYARQPALLHHGVQDSSFGIVAWLRGLISLVVTSDLEESGYGPFV